LPARYSRARVRLTGNLQKRMLVAEVGQGQTPRVSKPAVRPVASLLDRRSIYNGTW